MTTANEAIAAIRQALAHATPGPWVAAGPSFGAALPAYLDCVGVDIDGDDSAPTICRDTETDDSVYIAACNPVNIAALLARLDELENILRVDHGLLDLRMSLRGVHCKQFVSPHAMKNAACPRELVQIVAATMYEKIIVAIAEKESNE